MYQRHRRGTWVFAWVIVCLLGSYFSAAAAYGTEAPRTVYSTGGLQVSLPCTAEGWAPVTGAHDLDRAMPGQVLDRFSPRFGGVQIVVRCIDEQVKSMECFGDLETYAINIENLRKSTCRDGVVYCFFRSGNSQFWRREASFVGYPGCRQWFRFQPRGMFGMQYLIGDRFVEAGGHYYQVSSYAPTMFYHRYFELDMKYVLVSIKFPGE